MSLNLLISFTRTPRVKLVALIDLHIVESVDSSTRRDDPNAPYSIKYITKM